MSTKTKKPAPPPEYVVVANFSHKLIHGPSNYMDALLFAGVIRRGGGKVTIYKSTKA